MSLGFLNGDAEGLRKLLLSEQEAAELVGRSRKSIYRMRTRGELGYVRGQGGSIWIPRESLERWVNSHFVAPREPVGQHSPIDPRRAARRAGSERLVSLQEMERRHRSAVSGQ